MKTTITVDCPIEGLEDVKITYNLMATEDQIDGFAESLGTKHAAEVVAQVDGWTRSEEPTGKSAPLAFRIWMCRIGVQDAMQGFLTSPN
jgi:hypothetical protein